MGSISIQNLNKSFGGTDVLVDIDLKITDGEFVVVVGPSGCGKSTLLRILAGLEAATSGTILIDGINVAGTPPAKRGIAMVFQSYALYPHLDVRNNLGLGLKQSGASKEHVDERVQHAASMLELDELLARRPAELSGGQRQRVAIGRAIVREPKLFLFDEPLSNLDAGLRANTRLEIAKLHRELCTTMMYVTHDQIEAMTLANRMVVLNEGRVEQIGAPMEIYNQPATLFVAGFIGSPRMNFFEARHFGDGPADTAGLRPEHITLDRTQGDWPCEVLHAENLGAETLVYLATDVLDPLTVHLFGEHKFKASDRVFATPDANELHLFDAGGQRVNSTEI